jgi:hypothetical protein
MDFMAKLLGTDKTRKPNPSETKRRLSDYFTKSAEDVAEEDKQIEQNITLKPPRVRYIDSLSSVSNLSRRNVDPPVPNYPAPRPPVGESVESLNRYYDQSGNGVRRVKTKSPKRKIKSPKRKSRSPKRKSRSPKRKSRLQKRKSKAPKRKSKSPKRVSKTHKRKSYERA